jgi:hypothetical protein
MPLQRHPSPRQVADLEHSHHAQDQGTGQTQGDHDPFIHLNFPVLCLVDNWRRFFAQSGIEVAFPETKKG